MDKHDRLRLVARIGDRIRLGEVAVDELAQRSGVDARTIQTYLDGTVRRPQTGTVLRLAVALGIGNDDYSPTEAEAVDVIKGLLDTLPTAMQPALVARLVEEAVNYIAEAAIAEGDDDATTYEA